MTSMQLTYVVTVADRLPTLSVFAKATSAGRPGFMRTLRPNRRQSALNPSLLCGFSAQIHDNRVQIPGESSSLPLLLLISTVSLACDDAPAALNRAGNTGELIVSPGRIDFADTSVGDGTAADLVVQNQRTVETTIDVISIEGSHEGSFNVPNSIIRLVRSALSN